jgi:RNA-directed DNA polymerase
MALLKVLPTASGKRGVPQGGVLSPLLSNLYLNEVDKMLERAKAVTRHYGFSVLEYARLADDLVVLVRARIPSSIGCAGRWSSGCGRNSRSWKWK